MKPWKVKSRWPYVGKRDGSKRYVVGFRTHDGDATTKSFPSPAAAKAWMDDYVDAERRGKESLRRFLLDLDAAERSAAEAARRMTLAEAVVLYFAFWADPSLELGLAPSTFNSYKAIANRHILGGAGRAPRPTGEGPLEPAAYALAIKDRPVADFNEPGPAREWRQAMVEAGVPKPTRDRAWRVLSSALSWAATSARVPELSTNGLLAASEEELGVKRRSYRRGGTGLAGSSDRRAPSRRRAAGRQIPSWALPPQGVELIRQQMLSRVIDRDPLLALRDATIVSLQFGLGCRNQDVYGLRWRCFADASIAIFEEVVSWGALDEGKTEGSTRKSRYPALLREDLNHWRAALSQRGLRTRGEDFVIPGNLGGDWGVVEEKTGACHYSGNRARKWGPKYFNPAATAAAAAHPEYADIAGATPYALRRGGISLRLRADPATTVAEEVGTSLEMLNRHYAFAIQALRANGPRPVDEEWRAARAVIHGGSASPRLRVVA